MAAVKTQPFKFYFIGLLCSKYLQDEPNILTNRTTRNEVLKKLRGQQLVTNIPPWWSIISLWTSHEHKIGGRIIATRGWVVNDRSRSLHPRERGPVSIVQETGWASWFRLEGYGKFLPSLGFEPPLQVIWPSILLSRRMFKPQQYLVFVKVPVSLWRILSLQFNFQSDCEFVLIIPRRISRLLAAWYHGMIF